MDNTVKHTEASRLSPRVLIIAETPADRASIRQALERADGGTRIYEADALLTGLDRLADGDIELVVLDLSVHDNEGLDGLKAIRTYRPGIPVVVLPVTDDASTALRARQAGADDCLVRSRLNSERLARVLQRTALQSVAKDEHGSEGTGAESATVLGFLGSKGGVGTTTVACHIGIELKRQAGTQVLLIDLDVNANSMAFFMNAKCKHTIQDAANSILHLDESKWAEMIAQGEEGPDIMPSGGPVWLEAQRPNPERVRCLLRFARSLYAWIVIDFGRLTPLVARLSHELNQIVVVSSLEPEALNESTRVAHGLHEAGIPDGRVHLAINRAPKTAELSRAEVEKLVSIPVAAMLPECEKQFKEGLSAKRLLGQSRQFQMYITPLARKLGGLKETTENKKLFGLFRARA